MKISKLKAMSVEELYDLKIKLLRENENAKSIFTIKQNKVTLDQINKELFSRKQTCIKQV